MPIIPFPDMLFDPDTAMQKWKWSHTESGMCDLEIMYHADSRGEHGTWILYDVRYPEKPIPGEMPEPHWHKLTHASRAVRWFKERGIAVPDVLSAFNQPSTRDERRARRIERAKKAI